MLTLLFELLFFAKSILLDLAASVRLNLKLYILQSDLYVLLNRDSHLSKGDIFLSEDEELSIVRWKKPDGIFVIPIFTSKKEMKKAFNFKGKYIAIGSRTFFEISKNSWYVMNPYSDYGKEFTPWEIESLLNDSLLKINNYMRIDKNTQILIGPPEFYPHDLVKSIATYFSRRSQVTRAYLAQIHNRATDNFPHLMIAIEGEGDLSEIFSELNLVIQPTVETYGYVDLMRLGEGYELEGYFKEIEPFYTESKSIITGINRVRL